MIVVTGAAGFIGSCIASELNRKGRQDLILVDDLDHNDKWKNLRNLAYSDYLHKDQLFDWLAIRTDIEVIIHMGACSSTTETDQEGACR